MAIASSLIMLILFIGPYHILILHIINIFPFLPAATEGFRHLWLMLFGRVESKQLHEHRIHPFLA
jgi:hypothetical protein